MLVVNPDELCALAGQADLIEHAVGQRLVGLAVDADRAIARYAADGGGVVTSGVGDAPHDSVWPQRLAARTAKDGGGTDLHLGQGTARAMTRGGELRPTLGHRLVDQRALGGEEDFLAHDD